MSHTVESETEAAMVFTAQQIQQVIANQNIAAHDHGPAVRLLAGPGTGKSRTIAERVHWLITQQVSSNEICVISFTRATKRDLQDRVISHCTAAGTGPQSNVVRVSTMHSLALSALRRANLLTAFPSAPIILDEWEQKNLFDSEFAWRHNCTPSRAKEIRLAYDAYWQTLQMTHLQGVTQAEQQSFVAFYGQFTTFYSCILPGEVVRRCVEAINNGTMQLSQLGITRLIVDEFQDMNACDQQFIHHLAANGASVWVAGDDDQSIYSFRHADSAGLQGFTGTYANSTSHMLVDCLRCTPTVAAAGLSLISRNPSPPRIQKGLVSLYTASVPPVQGTVHIWRFTTDTVEANAIADSCAALVATGISPDAIMILLNNTRAQLPALRDALVAAGLQYSPPKSLAPEDTLGGRLLYALLRVVHDSDDYAAHRDLLELQHGVGVQTCLAIQNAAVHAYLNFKALFYGARPGGTFTQRCQAAIQRVAAVCQHVRAWQPLDVVVSHDQAIQQMLDHVFNVGSSNHLQASNDWSDLRSQFPDDTTLEETLTYLRADGDADRLRVLEDIHQRLGVQFNPGQTGGRIHILTMHGAKGLESKVVFIPGMELEITPSRRALQSAGLLQEQRRLLYVSITRGKAACVLTLARTRTGASAQALAQRPYFVSPRSPFVNEIGVPVVNRTAGLTASEAGSIAADCSNLQP